MLMKIQIVNFNIQVLFILFYLESHVSMAVGITMKCKFVILVFGSSNV